MLCQSEFSLKWPFWPKGDVKKPFYLLTVQSSIVGSLRDREVACSASDRQGSNFESCVWRTVSSQSSHHPQEVLLGQFSLYVHKGGLKLDSFHFYCSQCESVHVSLDSLTVCDMLFSQVWIYSYLFRYIDSLWHVVYTSVDIFILI